MKLYENSKIAKHVLGDHAHTLELETLVPY